MKCMGKYDAWDLFFRALDGVEQRFTFDELESLANVELPPSARVHPAWWWGDHVRPRWETHGWKASPRMTDGVVVFRKISTGLIPNLKVRTEVSAPESSADAVLVGCVATKRDRAVAAKDLYRSALWDKRRSYAEATGKPWAILSSEYGLVAPDQVIEPYDRYMGDQSLEYRQQWSSTTAEAIGDWCRDIDASSIEIHAGKNYTANGLELGLHEQGIDVLRPLAHHRQGEQLAWYDARLKGITSMARSGSDAAGDSGSREAPHTTVEPASVAQSTEFESPHDVVAALLTYGTTLEAAGAERSRPDFTPNKAANRFLTEDPWALLVAVISDYQIQAERAWELPYLLADRLGGWSPLYFTEHPEEVLNAFTIPSPLHRFSNQTGEWVVRAAQIVVDEYGGDAGRIWAANPTAADLQERLRHFDGISQKKAAMAVEILERDLGVQVSDLHGSDIAYDVHIRRVFLRAGLAQRDDVDHMVTVARQLHSERPGAMDFPAWMIGREWCRPSNPSCDPCPLGDVCPRLIDGARRVPLISDDRPERPHQPAEPLAQDIPHTREGRIQRAREMAEATSEDRAARREAKAKARALDIASLGRSRASAEARRLAEDDSLGYLGPIATPYEWKQALQVARATS